MSYKGKNGYLYLVLLLIFFAFITILPTSVYADNIIPLEIAKKLAKEQSRTIQNLIISREQLDIRADIARDKYISTDIQNNIDGIIQRIKQIDSEIKNITNSNMSPEEKAELIKPLETQMASLEAQASILKSNKPTGSTLNALETIWRNLSDAYDDMDKKISDAEKLVDYNVEVLYLRLLDLERTIRMQEKNIALINQQVRVEKVRTELGLATNLELNNLTIQYNSAVKLLKDLINKRTVLSWQLKDLIGIPINENMLLEDVISVPQYTVIFFDKIHEEAETNWLSLEQKKREIRNLNSDIYDENDSKNRGVLIKEKEIAEISLVGMREDLRQRVRTTIDAFEDSYRAWETLNIAKSKAYTSYFNDRTRFELGLISNIQSAVSEVSYQKALNEEYEAAHAWQLAKLKLELVKAGILTGY